MLSRLCVWVHAGVGVLLVPNTRVHTENFGILAARSRGVRLRGQMPRAFRARAPSQVCPGSLVDGHRVAGLRGRVLCAACRIWLPVTVPCTRSVLPSIQ